MTDERHRRQVAQTNRGKVVPGSGIPVEPRVLDSVMSLRLPADLAALLRDKANARGVNVSDLLRRSAYELVTQPIGWQCAHLNVTSLPGVLRKPSAWCGCDMEPVFHVDDLNPAPA